MQYDAPPAQRAPINGFGDAIYIPLYLAQSTATTVLVLCVAVALYLTARVLPEAPRSSPRDTHRRRLRVAAACFAWLAVALGVVSTCAKLFLPPMHHV